jgi:hypothetical protein
MIWDLIFYTNQYNIKPKLVFLKNYTTIYNFFNDIDSSSLNWNKNISNSNEIFSIIFKKYNLIFTKIDPNYNDLKFVNYFNDYKIKLLKIKWKKKQCLL